MSEHPRFTEEEIELYLRAPESLSEETRMEIAAALQHSDEARSLAESIRHFYRAFDRLGEEQLGDLERLVDKLCAPGRVIRLTPLRYRPAGPASNQGVPQTLMAAASEPAAPPRLTSASFADESQAMMVRVLHDRTTGSCRVFVMADELEKREHTLVTFPSLDLVVPTDSSGQASFPAPEGMSPDAWSDLESLVHFPIGACQVDLDGSDGAVGLGGVRGAVLRDYVLETGTYEGVRSLLVRSRGPGAPVVRFVWLHEEGGLSDVLDLSEGVAPLPTLTSGKQVTLRLYA